VSIDHDGTIPVDSNKGPCQRSSDNWDVNEAWVGVVTEVQGREVKEIDDEDELTPDEVATDEEHNPCELEEIVEDEVASYTCSCVDIVGIGREEGPDISNLGDEEKEPVDGGNKGVEVEGRAVEVRVDSPDGAAPLIHIIAWDIVCVLETGNDDKEPREDGCDLVGPDDMAAVRFALGERIVVNHLILFAEVLV